MSKFYGFPINEICKIDIRETVYNIQVADDHSYTANGAIVHNCQDFSMSGKRYRIRKLTPKECFRLMDVKDEDIDKIQQAGIAKTNQ